MPEHTAAPDATDAVAYLRCSTSRQDLSPDAQRAAIEAWAAAHGTRVVSWHEDLAVSGGAEIDKRPGLLAAIDSVKSAGASLLVVAKWDRLARDVLTAALVERLCERQGARIVSADGTGNGEGPEAQLMRNMVSAFAMYERAIIRARTKAALAVKRAKGERLGGIPYGFRVAPDRVKLEEHPEEQRAVALARRLRKEGRSLRAIGLELTASGFAPRTAKKWHVAVLARIVVKKKA
jgi:DNA invertase Pin-like site-specific DNA recombinase